MRHRKRGRKFGRERASRNALQAGLARAFVRAGTITTTLPKAKATRSFVERLITIAKNPSLANRRRLIQELGDHSSVERLLNAIGPRFRQRPGGYTRIVRLQRRVGDAAQLARLELVD